MSEKWVLVDEQEKLKEKRWDCASIAMLGLINSGLNTGAWDDYDDLAKSAFAIADAMLEASLNE